jgi:HD-GYP domain-containing protein (c-di-GMP phosphodiesterase class II)
MQKMKKSFKGKSFFHLLLESAGYRDLKNAFDKFLHRPIWWVADKKSPAGILPLTRIKRARVMEDYLSLVDYKKNIVKAIKQADRSKAPVFFEAGLNNTHGIAVPVVREGKCLGFFGVCALKAKPISAISDILSGYVDLIIKEINKEQELTRLYELVRPRAIALSTVHTIHRLISSTLDLKELFPRIARLSLQVLKAERVRICMIDQETKKLGCVTSVDYRKSSDIFKLSTKLTPLENRVVHTGRSIYKNNFISVPLVDEEVCGVITIIDKVGLDNFTIFDHEILATLAEQAIIAIRNAQLYKEQEDLTAGTIKSLGYLLDAKFPRLYTHTGLFEDLMLELGREINLTKKELKILQYSALMPDLGKLVMPTEMLQKKRGLSGKERKILKTHTVRGIEALKYLDVLKPVIPILLHHHEKYDGTGYPDKLKSDKIPLGARIMAIVDAFEAMVCYRPYREPMPFRMVVSEIRRQSGKQFDPDIVKVLVLLAKDGRLEQLMRRHSEELKKPL